MDPLTQTLLTSDSVKISVDLYQQKSHETIVIVCPGFFQTKNTNTFHQMNLALAKEHDVLAMDFRGHGHSSGLYTFSAHEGRDLEVALQFARERYQYIGILSFSLGAAIAINTVAHGRERIQSLIAVSGPCAFEEIEFKWWTPEAIRTSVDGLEIGMGCRPGTLFLKKERPIDNVRKLHPIPILFIHGTRDVIVGAEHSRRLYAEAFEPKRLEIIEGGSHAEALFRNDPEYFMNLVNRWFAQTLTSSANSPNSTDST